MERALRAALAAIVWAAMTGLPAAQTGIPKGTQVNPGRVTPGGGNFVVMKEVAAPINVNGTHWGGLRLAFKF